MKHRLTQIHTGALKAFRTIKSAQIDEGPGPLGVWASRNEGEMAGERRERNCGSIWVEGSHYRAPLPIMHAQRCASGPNAICHRERMQMIEGLLSNGAQLPPRAPLPRRLISLAGRRRAALFSAFKSSFALTMPPEYHAPPRRSSKSTLFFTYELVRVCVEVKPGAPERILHARRVASARWLFLF